jgi:hypothetical protein
VALNLVSCRLCEERADSAFPAGSSRSTSPMNRRAHTPCPREAHSIPSPVRAVSLRDATRKTRFMLRLKLDRSGQSRDGRKLDQCGGMAYA